MVRDIKTVGQTPVIHPVVREWLVDLCASLLVALILALFVYFVVN